MRTSYIGLCGTDLHISAGEHPRAKPGLVLGHEFVGRLVDAAGEIAAGSPAFVNPPLPCGECHACCDGRPNLHASARSSSGSIGMGASPSTPPCRPTIGRFAGVAELAAMVEPLAVAVHAVRRGCCARLQGASVTMSEVLTGRAATGGGVVTVGAYPGVVGVDLPELMFRELTIIGARVNTPTEVVADVGLIERGDIDPTGLITDVLPLEDGRLALEALRVFQAIKVLLAGPAASKS